MSNWVNCRWLAKCSVNLISMTQQGRACPHRRELKGPGRPQGIAPTIRRIGLASPCIVGAIPCGRPCAPTSELIQGFPVPPQNSPLAWQADPWYSRGDPCGQPWEVGLRGGAEVRAYGACSGSALFLFPTPQKE